MAENEKQETPGKPVRAEKEHPFSSNSVRLSGRQLIVTGAILVAVFALTPTVWEQFETFKNRSQIA